MSSKENSLKDSENEHIAVVSTEKYPSKPIRFSSFDELFVCYKCKKNKAVVDVREKACQSCFFDLVLKNLKTVLRQKIGSDWTESLNPMAICLSGGICSSVLLHLIHLILKSDTDVKHNTRNEVRLSPVAIHVRLPFIVGKTQKAFEEMKIFISEVYGYELVELSLGYHARRTKIKCIKRENKWLYSIYKDKIDNDVSPDVHEINVQLIIWSFVRQLLTNEPYTAHELIHLIYLRDIFAYMKEVNLKSCLMGHSADRMAQKCIRTICEGGGINLTHYNDYQDTRFLNYRFLRPLKNLSAKELYLFHHFSQVKSWETLKLEKSKLFKTNKFNEDENLTVIVEKFLNNVQSQFKSTFSVVNRTCEKIVPNFNDVNPNFAFENKSLTKATENNELNKNFYGDPKDNLCAICYGFKESTKLNLRSQWSTGQLMVLNSEIPEQIQQRMCFACKRLASSSDTAARLCVILAELTN